MNKLLFIGLLFCFAGCSPKSTVPVPAESKPQPGTPTVDLTNLSPCPNWLTLPNQDDISNEYIIYRDAIKQGNYKKAYEGWKKVYDVAPAADGKRTTVFDDGIRIYTQFFKEEKDEAKKKEYVAKVLDLYEQSAKCYPTNGNIEAQKAFQYYYSFPGYATDEEIFGLFRKALDKDGLKADYFILNPFTALLIQQFLESKVTIAETQKYTAQVKQILDNGLKNCKTPKECDPWNIINDYVPERLADLEGVEGFYDCTYYKNKYYKDFPATTTNCDTINAMFGRLRWAKCPDTDDAVLAIKTLRDANCRKVAEVKVTTISKAMDALNDGSYKEAINLLNQAIIETEDKNRKAELALHTANIYYGQLRNFPEARRAALQAASFRPNWGLPYMLIGNLYASSGPLCGPGRGFDSQRVAWAAIDKWAYAKSIDPSVANEANKKIANYSQYLPDKSDLFMMGIATGSTIRIPCWIQENTTVRPKP